MTTGDDGSPVEGRPSPAGSQPHEGAAPRPPYGPPEQGQPPYGPTQQGQPPYGPPQQGQPPYGPPQQGQPPYGPPQQGQPPYGPPQQGQPPYGPYQQGQPPWGRGPARPTQPGGGIPFWLLPTALGAGALIVLLVVVSVVALIKLGGSIGGNGGKPAAGGPLSGNIAWQAKVPAGGAEGKSTDRNEATLDRRAFGAWEASGLIVVVHRHQVVAFDEKTGQQRWQLAPPPFPNSQDPTLFCGMSTTARNNTGAVTFGPNVKGNVFRSTRCDGVLAVDLSSGKPRWQTVFVDKGFSYHPPTYAHPEVVGDMVVAEHEGNLVGYGADGSQRWFNAVSEPGIGNEACGVHDFLAGSEKLTVLYTCYKGTPLVAQVDPASGKIARKIDLPSDTVAGRIGIDLVSAEPAVVAVPPTKLGESGDGAYVAVDSSWGQARVVPQTGPYGQLDMLTKIRDFDRHQPLAVVSGDSMATVSVAKQTSEYRDTNKIVTFDLTTGKQRWANSLGPQVTGLPAAITKDGVLGMGTGTYENPPQLFRFAMSNGAASPMGPSYKLGHLSERNEFFWDGKRLYGVSLMAPDDYFLIYSLG